MKKRKLILLVALIALSMIICLSSCKGTKDSGTSGNTFNDNFDSTDATIVNLSGLGYSDGDKFFILDKVDFNDLSIDYNKVSPTSAINLTLSFNGESLLSFQKKSTNVYPSFTFTSVGDYSLKISASAIKPDCFYSVNYTLKVVAGGRPTEVRFIAKDALNNEVESLKAGNAYTITAALYSGEKPYAGQTGDIRYYWYGADAGKNDIDITLSNSKTDYTLNKVFYIKCNNTPHVYTCSFPVKNNFSGYVADNLVNGATLPAKYSGYFDKIKLYEEYEGGPKKEITIDYHSSGIGSINNKIVPMIAYGAEQTFVRYYDTMSSLDVGTYSGNYVGNGAVYQFDPRHASATVYLALAVQEKVEGTIGLYRMNYIELAETRHIINIANDVSGVISVYGILGNKVTEIGKYNSTTTIATTLYTNDATSSVIGNETLYIVDVYKTIDANSNGILENRKEYGRNYQYFEFRLKCGASDYNSDYVVSFDDADSDSGEIGFVNASDGAVKQEAYLYGIAEGKVTVTIKSTSGDVLCRVQVNVLEQPSYSYTVRNYSN